jgi:hypothetical protein
MKIGPKKHGDDRREVSDYAVDVARANLNYDPPPSPWRKTTKWTIEFFWKIRHGPKAKGK